MLLARTDGTWISFQTWHYAVFCPRTLEIWDVLVVLRLKCGKMKLCYLTTQMVRNKGEQKRVCLEKGEREDGEGDVSMP